MKYHQQIKDTQRMYNWINSKYMNEIIKFKPIITCKRVKEILSGWRNGNKEA
jgi:hypothetical protein